jgi:hypothetical protein
MYFLWSNYDRGAGLHSITFVINIDPSLPIEHVEKMVSPFMVMGCTIITGMVNDTVRHEMFPKFC